MNVAASLGLLLDSGIIGMCLTGAFPLALLRVDLAVAPVIGQPTIPFGLFYLGEGAPLGVMTAASARTTVNRL